MPRCWGEVLITTSNPLQVCLLNPLTCAMCTGMTIYGLLAWPYMACMTIYGWPWHDHIWPTGMTIYVEYYHIRLGGRAGGRHMFGPKQLWPLV